MIKTRVGRCVDELPAGSRKRAQQQNRFDIMDFFSIRIQMLLNNVLELVEWGINSSFNPVSEERL